MFTRAIAAAIVALGISAGAPASAQPAPQRSPQAAPPQAAPPEALPPEARARLPAAREFVTVMRMTELMKAIVPLMWQQMVAPVMAGNDPKMKADVEAIGPMLIEAMLSDLSGYGELLAEIYAARFTEDELKTLTAFMRTPTGQSFVSKQGELAQAGMAAGQRHGRQMAVRMQARIEQELKKRQQK